MQAQPDVEIDVFAEARAYFERTLQWLESGEARCTHIEVERELRQRGEVLMRAMLQGHLDFRAAEEKRNYQIGHRDSDVKVRSRPRQLETGFGRVKVTLFGESRAT